MKRLLFLAVLVMMLMAPALAFSTTFQGSGDLATNFDCLGSSATCVWVENATGGNSYVNVLAYAVGNGMIINKDPEPTTYAAATLVRSLAGPEQTVVDLYDGSMTQIGVLFPGAGTNMRCEVFVAGGYASLYCDGKFKYKAAVSSNPSYIGWATETVMGVGTSTTLIDDIVYGSTENKYIFGMPRSGMFIRKDMVNPAASGLYYENGTLAATHNMSTTWGVGSSNASQTVILKEWSSGTTSQSVTTAAGTQAGTISWAIYDAIINNPNSPYGYYVTTIDGSGEVSDVIPYISYGASVAFDQTRYARGDTAIITYAVDSGGYWDTSAYAYRLDVLDVYGNVVDTQTVTTRTGSKSVTFTSSDTLGVYYAVLIAKPTGGNDIWLNLDTAELTGYLVLTGNVYNAETAAYIPVANVSITQGSTVYNKVTAVDGNYTTDAAFVSGATISVNVTSSGYLQYTDTFTPLEGKTIGLNFTLIPNPATVSGVALGGVVRDNVYGRPIPNVDSVTAANSTYSQSYTVSGNSVGYYLIDDSVGAHLVNGRCYTVTATKVGYTSVSSYFKCVVGV